MRDLRRLRFNLATFAEAVGCPLAPWQADSLALERRTTVIVAPRQTGKSRSLAVLALHRAFAHAAHRVLVVSAGEDASRRLLAEAANLATRSPLLAGSVVDENAGLLVLSNGSEVRSVPASERQVRGWAVDLLIVDEAAQCDDSLLLGAAIPTTAARPDARIVLAGSPGASVGAFYDFATSDSPDVASFTWRRDDARWLSADAIEQARAHLPPALFTREFEGEFAEVGDEKVIPREWIEQARRRGLDPGPLVLAADIARRPDGDETVVMALRGGVAHVEWAMRGADLMQTAGRLANLKRSTGAPLYLDAIGLGWGVFDRLREQGIAVTPFTSRTGRRTSACCPPPATSTARLPCSTATTSRRKGSQPCLWTLPGGSQWEVAQQEAERQTAVKRKWCEARGIRYIVHVDPLPRQFS